MHFFLYESKKVNKNKEAIVGREEITFLFIVQCVCVSMKI